MRVGNHLYFDMAWLTKITFYIYRVIAKGGFGFGPSGTECFG
jgi:hypothetical protein